MNKFLQVSFLVITCIFFTACGGGTDTNATANGSGKTDESGNSGGGGTSPGGNGVATVNWTAPSTRESGASISMSELGGYKIYYGDNSGALVYVITVNDPYKNSYQLVNLVSGRTYYFRITAFDSNKFESIFSNMISRTAS